VASLPALYFDIDGVLAFQPEGSVLAVNGRFGTSYLVAEATTYPWAATIPQVQQDWLEASKAVVCANLAPDTIAIATVRKAVKAGYPVTVITERDPSLAKLTAAWLAYFQVPYDNLALPGKGMKGERIAAGGGKAILIDDSPANEPIASSDVQVWVPPRPWTPAGDPPAGVWRFSSWRDVRKKLGLLRLVPWQLRRPAGRRRPLLWRGGGTQFPEPGVVHGDEPHGVPVVALHRPLVRDHPGTRDHEGDHRRGLPPLAWLELRLRALGESGVDPVHGDPGRRPLVRACQLLTEHDRLTRAGPFRLPSLPASHPVPGAAGGRVHC